MIYQKARLVVLISDKGTGSNLEAIIKGCLTRKINGQIIGVISDVEDAPGLNHARNHNLKIEICKNKESLLSVLKGHNPDFICLAGWKQIILDEVILAYSNKILNLHPGLIPDHPEDTVSNPDGSPGLWNKGKLTTRAIDNFLNSHSTYAGSSIHFLTLDFDYGPVLGRTFEKIELGDTTESLYARLKKRENDLYVEVLNKLTHE